MLGGGSLLLGSNAGFDPLIVKQDSLNVLKTGCVNQLWIMDLLNTRERLTAIFKWESDIITLSVSHRLPILFENICTWISRWLFYLET